MTHNLTKRIRIGLTGLGTAVALAGCGSTSDSKTSGSNPSGGSAGGPVSGGSGGSAPGGDGIGGTGAQPSAAAPVCLATQNDEQCMPRGMHFALATWSGTAAAGVAVSGCSGANCPSLTQPESGKLCLSGTVPPGATAWFLLALGVGQRLGLDATALGISQISFVIDTPPPGGVLVDTASLIPNCTRGLPECIAFGFDLPRVLLAGPTSAALSEFLQEDPASPYQTLDLHTLVDLGFTVDAGPYDFCVHDLKFLTASGDEVSPET